MIKRLFSIILLASAVLSSQAQYQVTNGDFETWTYDGDNLPNNWNSFQTADGTYASAGYSSSNRQVKKSTNVRPGSTGSYSCNIWARSVLGVVAQGNVTTGRVHAGSTSATNKNNYNYSDIDGTSTNPAAMKITGHPDAISFWAKFVPAGNVTAYPNAHLAAIVHDNHEYITYGLPENDTEANKSYVVASAVKDFPSCDWTNFVADFEYTANDDSKYILINVSTNAYPGKGTKNDSLYIDDIVLVYNSELASLKYNGSAYEVAENMTIAADYNESLLEVKSNGHAAKIEKNYDATTGLLTITVKGENISEDATNKHVYTIQFNAPVKYTCKEYIVTDGSVYGTTYNPTFTVQHNANGTKNITCSAVRFLVGTTLSRKSLTVDGVQLDSNNHFSATSTLGDYSCTVEGGIANGKFSAKIEIPSLNETLYFGYDLATLKVTSAQWGTFIAPFDVELPNGVSAYTVASTTGNTLNLTNVGTIAKNTPVILFAESATTKDCFGVNEAASNLTYGLLTGTYEEISAPAGSYVLKNQDGVVGFYKSISTTKVPANRCYLNSSAGSAKAFFFTEGETDGIEEINADANNNAIYDLTGRRVAKAEKGMYIINGKKVLVK